MRSRPKHGYDYVAVGHVTVDVLEDERGQRRQAGGGALYSGLQASRLGLRTLLVTAGREEELSELLGELTDELDLAVQASASTTTLLTSGTGARRTQRLLAWAGAISAARLPSRTQILHLAPIARETPSRWECEAKLVGLTPQGLVRRWQDGDEAICLATLDPAAIPQRIDALVLSQAEQSSCEALLQSCPLSAITAGEGPTELRSNGISQQVPPRPIRGAHDDLGAGDVFAAAFFVGLLEGRSPRQAAELGNAAAAVRIGGIGPHAIGDRVAIEGRLAGASS